MDNLFLQLLVVLVEIGEIGAQELSLEITRIMMECHEGNVGSHHMSNGQCWLRGTKWIELLIAKTRRVVEFVCGTNHIL